MLLAAKSSFATATVDQRDLFLLEMLLAAKVPGQSYLDWQTQRWQKFLPVLRKHFQLSSCHLIFKQSADLSRGDVFSEK